MSRKDTYHNIVKEALNKGGWTITHDPYMLKTDPRLAVDLGAERVIAAEKGTEKIAVEIKSFLRASQIADLEDAIGQYSIYKLFIQQQEPERTLYLAVPTYAFENILSRQVGRVTIRSLKINVIVYSLLPEEPLQWKNPESFTNNV